MQRDRSGAAVAARAPRAAAVDSASSSGSTAAVGVSGGAPRWGTSGELGANVESLQTLLARSNTWSID
jgi:hypothetical protein